jgi:predicted ribosome quality control (RQC) complex YloA/Tae2 family protein
VTESDFEELRTSDLAAGKWLGRTLGLPKKYVEGIFEISNVDSKCIGSDLTSEQIKKLYDTTKKIVTNVVTGNHEPVIIRDEKTEIIPVKLGNLDDRCTVVNSFIEGLDTVFTENLLEIGKSIQTGGSDKKIKELESQLSEQEKAIETVKEKSNHITSVANSLFEMISKGITTIEDSRAQEILSNCNSKLIKEKGITLITVDDEKIKINLQSPLQSIASILFNEAKRKSGAIKSIEQIKINTQKKLTKLQNTAEKEKDSVSFAEIRKKNWYERYRWFFTSDGILAIGGRDAPSNSAVVRKHLEKNDKIFHGDIFGSPFFILKDAENPPASSLNEVAHATVCFSRAWREGMYGVSAYWVNPEQVKKSAPSGQFLPKGSFTIEGQRNFVKISTLKLAVGLIPQGDDYVVTCGPPDTIKKNSICYVIIEPHGLEMVDAAKKIRLEFLKLEEEITKKINIDDFVRALPAGASQITEIGLGDAS